MKILTLITACIITVTSYAQQSYVLKQDFPLGKKYGYTLNSDQIINQKVEGKTLNFIQNVGTDYIFDVLNEKNGEKEIRVTYKRINLKSVGMGNEVVLDSDTELQGVSNPFGGLKNASFTITLDKDGAVKAVSGIDKMVDGMISKMSKDSTQIAQLKASLGKQFNAGVLKESLESSFKIYPQKAVKIGESWTINTKIQIVMPIEFSTTYTLKEVKNGIATLSIKGSLLSKAEFDNLERKTQADLKGLNMGDLQVDIKTGMILNSHIRMEMDGKLKSASQDIDLNVEGINKITGKELN